MTRVLNDATSFKEEMIEGLTLAYPQIVRRVPEAFGVMAVGAPRQGHVSVLIGGGSGHYPAFAGLVGPGLATGAVIGDIFTSPSAEQIYRCTKALDGGAGVLYSFGNYSGDVMNFAMAAARAEADGIPVKTVLVTDDLASAPPERAADRRGIAGDFFVFKIAGTSADQGRSLDEVAALAEQTNLRTRSLGVAFEGCTVPGAEAPLFTVDPDKMELGLGIHGEPGVRTVERVKAAELARLLVEPLLEEVPTDANGRIVVLLNGLGSTKYEELFVLYREVRPLLDAAGLEVHDSEVGELVTSLDMAGCSLTLFWLNDELGALYDTPSMATGYRRGAR
jgi:dihydroxyacetone kinase